MLPARNATCITTHHKAPATCINAVCMPIAHRFDFHYTRRVNYATAFILIVPSHLLQSIVVVALDHSLVNTPEPRAVSTQWDSGTP
jgi:hypothetical protein